MVCKLEMLFHLLRVGINDTLFSHIYDTTHKIHGKAHHKYETRKHHFTKLVEYLRIFILTRRITMNSATHPKSLPYMQGQPNIIGSLGQKIFVGPFRYKY